MRSFWKGIILHLFIILRLFSTWRLNFEKLISRYFIYWLPYLSLFEDNNQFVVIIDDHDILVNLID
jgi:hypothetical protein